MPFSLEAEPTRRRSRRRGALAVLALAVAVTTCRDAPSGPTGLRGFVNVAPVFAGNMDPAAFGIVIDSVRAIAIRPPSDTLTDRTVAFPADSSTIELDLPVVLQDEVETLTVVLQYLGAGQVLFSGSLAVEVTAGPPGNAPPASIPVLYVGPGVNVDSLIVTPVDSILSWGDSLRFRVAAFQGGIPVTQFYVSWTTSDPAGTTINGAGVLRAPGRRDTVFVIARTPGDSAVDSTAVSFMPLPAAIAIVSGNGQSGSTGAPLAQALRVQVTATDGVGVAFARVQFRVALGGGSVADPVAIADDRGFAQTIATLGLTQGPQVFEASIDPTHFVTFNATAIAGQAVRLEFTAQPGATTAGVPLSPPVQVTARDAAGSVAAGFTGPVTVALLANPGGATLLGTTTVNAIGGVASFSDLTLQRAAQGYTLAATSPNLTAATSAAFGVAAAAVDAGQSTVSAAPATITASAGASQGTITVTARDVFGNPVSGATAVLAATGAGNTVVQPGATNAAGVATGTVSSTVAGAKTVTVTINGVTITQNTVVTVVAAGVDAAQSTVAAAPATITASTGASQSTITVTARDAFTNPIDAATVVLAATGTGNTLTQPAATNAAGVTTGTVSSTGAGAKAVSATINGVAITQTAAVTVQAAAVDAGQSTVAAAPATITASTGVSQSTVTATARDVFGNPVGGATVVLAATGPGNTLTQPAGPTNAAGVATGTVSSTAAGAKTVSATINTIAITQTAVVTVQAAAVDASLSIVAAAPDSITASTGASQSTITVTARDAFTNPVAGATVVLAATGTGNTVTQPAVTNAAGVTTGTVSSTGAGAKTLSATINSIAITQTTVVTVVAAAVDAAQSTVAAAPATITASTGASQSTITVTARDAFTNPVAGAAVVLAATGTGNTLTQPAGPTNAAGVATGTLSATRAEVKTVSATIGGVAITQTAAVTVQVAAVDAAQSTVVAAPDTITASSGTSQSTITVTARDAFANPVAGATVVLAATGAGNTITQPAVTNAAGVTTGTVSSTVSGIKTVSTTINGIAVTQTGAVTVLPAAVSAAVTTVVAAPASITASAGTSASTITVTARDGFANPVSGLTVVLAATGTGNTLTQPAGPTNPAGVATGTLSSTVAEGKTVSATVGGVAITQTAGVTVTAAAASQIALSAGNNQTATANTAVAIAPSVIVRDPFSNPVAGVAVTFAVTAGGGTVAGGTATSDAVGIATVTSWTLGTAAGTNNNTLQATAAGLAGSPVTFTASATAAAASQLQFTAQPTDEVAGAAIAPPVVVTVRDAFGNTTTTFNGNVAVAIGTNPVGGTLSGTDTVAAVAGVATFADLSIDRAGTGYTLAATSGAFTPATSAPFNITAAAATQLAFTTQPTDAVAGVAIAPAVVVTALDGFGNIATGFAGDVTVVRSGLADCPPTLIGTTTVATVSGAAAFTDLVIQEACVGAQLQASSGTLPAVQSAPFTITAAAAAQLILVSGDGQATVAGGVLPEALLVRVTDQFGNGVVGESVNWAVVAGGGSVTPSAAITDGGGFASAVWTLGTAAGTHVVQASSGALSGSPVLFTATAFPAGTTRVWVGGDATAPDDWSTDANWREGVTPTGQDNVFVTVSAPFQPVVSQDAVVGGLSVQAGASVTIATGVNLTAGGDVDAGATIGGPGSLHLAGTGVTLQGTVPNLVVSGGITVAGPVSVAGNLLVTGSLNLAAHAVTVAGDFATSGLGTLAMTQVDATLLVQGSVGFNGGSTLDSLTDGTIVVAGDFVVTDSEPASFRATGGHTVIFNGTTLQRIDGVRSIRVSQSHFQNLAIAGTDSVRPVTALQVSGTLSVSSGTFTVGGQSVFVGGDFVTTGTGILRMVTAADTVSVQGNAVFAGGNESAQMFDGLLRVGGDLTEAGSPPSGSSFEPAGSHVVELNGTAPQTISFGDPALSHFGSLLVTNTSPEGVALLTDASAVDSLTVQTGSLISLGSSVFTLSDVINHGTVDVANGTLEVTRSFRHLGGAVLQGSGAVEVAGASLATFDGIVRPGTSPGLLTISGGAALGSTSVVEIELGGLGTPGIDHDQLRVLNGTFTLGGTLNVGTLTGFTPKAGDSFQVLSFGSRAGDFAAVTGLDLGGGVVLDTVWSATDLQLVARQVIALEVAPIDLATNPGKGLVYALATPFGQKTGGPPMVMTIDATTNQPVDTVVLEAANPYALGVNTASEKVYVSDFQNQLIVVHAGAGTVGTIPLPQPGFTTVDETKNVVYVPAGFQVGLDPSCVASFCPIYAPVLFKVDGVADTVFTADTVFVGGWDWHAYGAAFNPNDGLVYVAIYDSTLVARNVVRIVDPGSRAIVGSIDVPGKPFALAINPVTNKLYVSGDVDNAITIVDLGTPTPSVLKTIAIGGYIPNITVDAVSNRIYVPNYDAGTVTIIDGATDEVLTVLQVGAPGDGAYDAVVSPVDGALLYVARFNAGEITILRQ